MNKYELAVVVSAKIEDDARTEVVEKVKALVERFGGQINCDILFYPCSCKDGAKRP